MKRSSFSDFVEKSNGIHKGRYDYPEQTWNGYAQKVRVHCRAHGEFNQSARNHVAGSGCPVCHRDSKTPTNESVMNKAMEAAGGRFTVIEADMRADKVTLDCTEHGKFELSVQGATRGSGCPTCARESSAESRRGSIEHWVGKAREMHGDRYDYKSIRWDRGAFLLITCPEHGDFEQGAKNHSIGQGCPHCGKDLITGRKGEAYEDVTARAKEAHKGKFEYLGWADKTGRYLRIICPVHGEFTQMAKDHARGVGCRSCSHSGESKAQVEIFNYCRELIDEAIPNYKFTGRKELDVYIPSKSLAIEFNGAYWHSTAVASNLNIYRKQLLAEKQGIRVINIYEDEWSLKRDVVEQTIKHLLGKSTKIGARDCKVVDVTPSVAFEFCENHHLQGGAKAQLNIGLEHLGTLVAVMSFSRVSSIRGEKARTDKMELIRLSMSQAVMGGASKLFKHFVKNNPQVSIVLSYSDNRIFKGGVYAHMGFLRAGHSRPDYFYVRSGSPSRHHKAKFTREKLAKIEGFDPGRSERENMERWGWNRLYDCGKTKWEWAREQSPSSL